MRGLSWAAPAWVVFHTHPPNLYSSKIFTVGGFNCVWSHTGGLKWFSLVSLITTLLSQGYILGQLLGAGKISGAQIPKTGENWRASSYTDPVVRSNQQSHLLYDLPHTLYLQTYLYTWVIYVLWYFHETFNLL